MPKRKTSTAIATAETVAKEKQYVLLDDGQFGTVVETLHRIAEPWSGRNSYVLVCENELGQRVAGAPTHTFKYVTTDVLRHRLSALVSTMSNNAYVYTDGYPERFILQISDTDSWGRKRNVEAEIIIDRELVKGAYCTLRDYIADIFNSRADIIHEAAKKERVAKIQKQKALLEEEMSILTTPTTLTAKLDDLKQRIKGHIDEIAKIEGEALVKLPIPHEKITVSNPIAIPEKRDEMMERMWALKQTNERIAEETKLLERTKETIQRLEADKTAYEETIAKLKMK